MESYHPLKDLAFRDIVARSIDMELKKSGDPCVYLDISHKGKDFIMNRFPHIYETCLSFHIDISREPIPVVPAAHYMCGGLLTDEQGRTNLKNLFAIGEVACTGLHGANRLASNSLLEALVFARRAALKAALELTAGKQEAFPQALARAKRRAEIIQEEIKEYYWDFLVSQDLLELRNLALVAELIITCASLRKESRGLHFNLDYPSKDNMWLQDTVIWK